MSRCKLKDVVRRMEKLIHLRYLDLSNNDELTAQVPRTICQLYNLQTLNLKWCGLKEIPREIRNLIDLRHLDLSCNRLKEIPGEIGNLIQLRYLNLHYNQLIEITTEIGNLVRLRCLDLSRNGDIKELPETICNLCDLQTLHLSHCWHLSRLPEGIERLVNLRHLDNSLCNVLYQIPQGIGKLTGLRTLRQFYGGRGWSNLGYLKELDQLSGLVELHISLHDRDDMDEARTARLMNKIHIEELKVFFVHEAKGRIQGEVLRNEVALEALAALRPPPDLKRLTIFGYQGTRFPSWISSCLNHVRRLDIRECNYISTLPCLGKLSELEKLSVWGMDELKFVGREFLGITGDIKSWSGISFPMLKKLSFRGCPQWEEWEDIMVEEEEEGSTTVEIMPSLVELEITGCGLTVLPNWLLRKASSLEILTDMSGVPVSEDY
ncbi:UNVERIFIED_CONTAM: putative disease resistance RPP13-like protein 1 [Sesamum calycinum]|uniref:Disease resistance RPP13-like protein 1 n=1 Tax=Sesamum calycinum TaxID=2727403 RepID=A0AAW2QJA3_9LAMI